MSRRIGGDGVGNLWFRCTINNIRMIGRDSSGCWKKCRGDSSSGGCWNRCRVNSSRMVSMDTSARIGRDDISCCRCEQTCSSSKITRNWN